MMRRLDKTILTDEDIDYIRDEKEAWEEVERFVSEYYEEGLKEGKIETLKQILRNPLLPDGLAEQIKQQLADITKQSEVI